jgi:hypothetical protein
MTGGLTTGAARCLWRSAMMSHKTTPFVCRCTSANDSIRGATTIALQSHYDRKLMQQVHQLRSFVTALTSLFLVLQQLPLSTFLTSHSLTALSLPLVARVVPSLLNST